jgi:hypothetical protein
MSCEKASALKLTDELDFPFEFYPETLPYPFFDAPD